jgi:hypothetical protein
MYIDSDVIVVSIRAHQYKTAETHMMKGTPIQVGAAETSTVYRGDQEPGTTIQARAAAEGNQIQHML